MITKTKLLLLGILICLVLPMAMASDVYQKSTAVDLKVPCINAGAYCSAAANCSLTILYPDNTILVKDVKMTNQGAYHNYTLSAAQTFVLGTYSGTATCVDGTHNGYSSFNYVITTTGNQGTNLFNNTTIILFIAVAIILFIIAIVLKNLYLSFIAGAAFLLLGIYLVIFGFYDIADVYTRGLGFIALAMGLYLTIVSAYELITEYDNNYSSEDEE